MPGRILFITGTDTSVGKTVLTCLLTRHLRDHGVRVAALKPICSGGRDDAGALRAAIEGALALDEINPWHFRAPLAPLMAARRERKRVKFDDVIGHVRSIQKRFEVVLVEGAGGLLSPLGEGFNSRDLIVALRATPIIVCPNRLGAVNHSLLTIEALPRTAVRRARVVLIDPLEPDSASLTNRELLSESLGTLRVLTLPWLPRLDRTLPVRARSKVRRVLDALLK
jgi:dethiobiotin synthetase